MRCASSATKRAAWLEAATNRRIVLGPGTVDAFIIGFESTAQVDDLLKRAEDALASLRK